MVEEDVLKKVEERQTLRMNRKEEARSWKEDTNTVGERQNLMMNQMGGEGYAEEEDEEEGERQTLIMNGMGGGGYQEKDARCVSEKRASKKRGKDTVGERSTLMMNQMGEDGDEDDNEDKEGCVSEMQALKKKKEKEKPNNLSLRYADDEGDSVDEEEEDRCVPERKALKKGANSRGGTEEGGGGGGGEGEASGEAGSDAAVSSRGPLDRIQIFVAVLCFLSFVEGISLNGLPHINLTSLQTRYELTSAQSGLITSCGDIGSISVILLVSFYGGKSHRPRVVAGGALLLALGSLLFVVPHILVEPYSFGGLSPDDKVCRRHNGTVVECETHREAETGSAARFLPAFMLGQTLQGMGFSPVFTVGFAYIDEHASADSTAVYMGFTYAVTVIGIAVGYVCGGQVLSKVWVDVGAVDTSTIHISNKDKRWVGAWWIGYIITFLLFTISAVILSFFPRSMPVSAAVAKEKASPESSKEPEKLTLLQLLLSFPRALWSLILNPLYILLVLTAVGDTLIVSSLAGFGPKIIEEKFSVMPKDSGMIMGVVTVLGGAGGMAMGGYLVSRNQLKFMGIMQLVCCFMVVSLILGGGAFFISCPVGRFAGVSSVYGTSSVDAVPHMVGLQDACNGNCSCHMEVYDPVCGQDDVTYFSPCFAGCLSDTGKGYDNCSCVAATLQHGGETGSGRATLGSCEDPCPQLWAFVVALFFAILTTCLIVTPVSVSVLRVVPNEERSIGLGTQFVLLRLLGISQFQYIILFINQSRKPGSKQKLLKESGTIPGPIIVGALLDDTCQLWQTTCNGAGSCWMYDAWGMSLNLFAGWCVIKVMSLVLLSLVITAYRQRLCSAMVISIALLVLAIVVYMKKGSPVIINHEQALTVSVEYDPGVSLAVVPDKKTSDASQGFKEKGSLTPREENVQEPLRQEPIIISCAEDITTSATTLDSSQYSESQIS